MASWNSVPLEITYEVLGWIAFVAWSISFYPQVILNFRRKSVVGLNFDFVVLNLTKHSSYLIYNATLYFSSAVQKQYRDKYGSGEMIPVAANDVAFSTHAVILTAITLFQIAIYEILIPNSESGVLFVDGLMQRGAQKVSKISLAIVSAVWLAAGAFMNFRRKSTDGFSIGNILLDFSGGVANYAQMTVQSIDQNSWVNFYGNIGKTLLSLISIFFDLLFMCQHFLLYPGRRELIPPKTVKAIEPLMQSSDRTETESENV
ncbi:hypothetical protein L484_017679 [Morus notabilis]|uniref:Cystinosin homolog n=1 Tax=Morus notabilis TaxID=981085 RepID=W9SGK2_9ROSA|nr:hypothetical protein L484_017679 [Morus notabilis]